jgi:hypothetical protein
VSLLLRATAACLVGALAACAAMPVATTPEPVATGMDSPREIRTLSGRVDAIDNGCFADGECSVTVDGLKVVTLRGWSRATWGPRDPELVPGDRVDVRCRATSDGCTLEGSEDYFLRRAR